MVNLDPWQLFSGKYFHLAAGITRAALETPLVYFESLKNMVGTMGVDDLLDYTHEHPYCAVACNMRFPTFRLSEE